LFLVAKEVSTTIQQHSQQFGGNWTEEKLNIFTEYLNAYLIALQNQKFSKVYIDAFAGTGEIVTRDGEQHLVGSAKRALSVDLKFDRYCFIEKDKKKVAELQKMIDIKFPDLVNRVSIYCGDANARLKEIINQIDWRFYRGLLFLDPCATEVNWSSLEMIAQTKSIDMWYLFPFSALNRMLTKDGNMDTTWATCIDRLLGDSSWRTEFYKEDPQLSLFDLGLEGGSNNRLVKDANLEHIKEYIIGRLQTIFPCVSKYPRIFRNKNNSPLFLFCFAISNDSDKARGLALKIADHILKPKTDLGRCSCENHNS
jgi:three-Cys-motif partner protein